MTTRIRWEPTEHGGWTGHAGTLDCPLFNLRRRRVAWVLTAVIPGTSYRIIRDGAVHPLPPVAELKDQAERWLAEFVSSLGAVFPGMLREIVTTERARRDEAAGAAPNYEFQNRCWGWTDALDWVLALMDGFEKAANTPSAPRVPEKETS